MAAMVRVRRIRLLDQTLGVTLNDGHGCVNGVGERLCSHKWRATKLQSPKVHNTHIVRKMDYAHNSTSDNVLNTNKCR